MEKLKNDNSLINDSNLNFKLENFEGPLDLLLHLIKQNKMEIQNIELSKITEQYLNIIENADLLDLETASEFIEVAATLIEIKSKALLPKILNEENDEEDPESLLLARLQEYQLIKESAEKLKAIENTERFYKEPSPSANKVRIVLKDMQLDMLLDAFAKILVKVKSSDEKSEEKEIQREKFTVAEKIANIKDTLIMRKKVMFSELFTVAESKDEIITIFLALLELLKVQEIKVNQNENFEDIEILKNEEEVA